jgi:hypothetical protein
MSALSASLEASDVLCNSDATPELEQIVEQGTPITLFTIGDFAHPTHWDGQAVLQVNPSLHRLEVRFCLLLTRCKPCFRYSLSLIFSG